MSTAVKLLVHSVLVSNPSTGPGQADYKVANQPYHCCSTARASLCSTMPVLTGLKTSRLNADCLAVQAIGKLYTLWTAFARFYERHGDIDNARIIFDKATQVRQAVSWSTVS